MFVIKHYHNPIAREYTAVECGVYRIERGDDGVLVRYASAPDSIVLDRQVLIGPGEEAFIENSSGRTIDAIRNNSCAR